MIDVFGNYFACSANTSKTEEDLTSRMVECLHNLGKKLKSKTIYTEHEGTVNKEAIQKYLRMNTLNIT